MQVTDFTPDISDGTLDVMRARLLSARWPQVIGDDSWSYGVPQAWLKDMVAYWADEWRWPDAQQQMARYRHVMADIEGLAIHAMVVPGTGPDPIPLICTHGWPWTFWDFRHIVDLLADPASHGIEGPSFDVVVPSLPGFGFSTPLDRAGVAIAEIADLWVELMSGLGYDRFVAHGGDWGSIVTSMLGHAHADRLLGAHLSLPTIPGVSRRDLGRDAWADDELWMIERAKEADPVIRSHLAVHTLDPQTLAYGLADSPVGTAAWIWERRRNWSDCDGDVESVFDREHLCTTAALYWATGAITSSLRLYFEHFGPGLQLVHDRTPTIEAPTAFAISPKELVFLPRSIAEERTNLVQWSLLDAGGHFAAAEQPEAIAADLRSFVAKL